MARSLTIKFRRRKRERLTLYIQGLSLHWGGRRVGSQGF